MTITSIITTDEYEGGYQAVLHHRVGEGALILPILAEDFDPRGGPEFWTLEWRRVLTDLDARGWELTEDYGEMVPFGVIEDGMQAVGLYGLNPMMDVHTGGDRLAAHQELIALVRATVGLL